MPSATHSSAVVFSAVRLMRGSRIVLEDINLEIGCCEFVGVLGPNGSGKTTLMRAILGLIPPTSGTITVLGEPVRRGNPHVGYVPQHQATLVSSRLRGWDVVASGVRGERLGLPVLGAHDRNEIDRALALVGAEDLSQRPVSQLSGGERQRLLLAQALIGEPHLLLLDEPLVSLDPHYADDVVGLVRNVQKELGISVLFSAHELNPLLPAMDRVLYLGSRHAQLGAVDDVITGPVLSRLYGSHIDVVKVNGSVFVMSGRHHIEEHHTRSPGHHAPHA
jgi:zinc/manganese transport system ATP-binding protein